MSVDATTVNAFDANVTPRASRLTPDSEKPHAKVAEEAGVRRGMRTSAPCALSELADEMSPSGTSTMPPRDLKFSETDG
jgi:hypothetical protein